ncbi:MAG: translation initiation factor IF-2 subunit gamma, partial [Nitrososphaeraceae archaeon]
AQHKLNIDALIGSIENSIKTPSRSTNKAAIMHVLRSFDINKPGLPLEKVKGGVIGGALIQGELSVGEEIEIRPGFMDDKRGKYEPIRSVVSTLGTGAGLVERVRPGGLVAIGTKLDPAYIKSDSLIGSVVGKPDSLPDDVEEISIEVQLFDTAVGTQEMVKVEPIKTKEPLRLNVGTAAALGAVTSSKDSKVEVKLRKPLCLLPRSRVAISRRISDRWRLIGAGVTS